MTIRRVERVHHRKRVAAYCRVSTAHDAQLESYDAQVRVYTEMIRKNPDWEFVGIYADPGISGVCAEKRPAFMRMVADAQQKKLDIVLCKSISRFARNAIETQKYVQALREKGVAVIFEENHIRTDDPSASFVFSLLASVAQDESRSNSENVKWSIQQRYARGEYNFGSNHILGYDSVQGVLVPNGEAWIVREMYRRFLLGQTYRQISDALIAQGARTKRDKAAFSAATIRAVLMNETYTGDMRLQQAAPKNYLTKRPDPKVNYRTYYLEDDHEPLIDCATWEAVQRVFAQRKEQRSRGVRKE